MKIAKQFRLNALPWPNPCSLGTKIGPMPWGFPGEDGSTWNRLIHYIILLGVKLPWCPAFTPYNDAI